MKQLRRDLPEASNVAGQGLPEKILQFGGGVFLRGFIEDFVDRAIRAGNFAGRIVIAQRSHDRRSRVFQAQEGLYTVWLRGQRDGQPCEEFRLLGSVSRVLSTESEWDQVLAVGRSAELEVIVSNATEVGYAIEPDDSPTAPRSFPAKLACVLYDRWKAKGAGLVIVPCELLERNGEMLRQTVLELAATWKWPGDFADWVANDNVFCSTLVDRIVTGPPHHRAAAEAFSRLGYRDELLIAAEPYALFAIEDQGRARDRFPIHLACPEVLYTDDATPYRERKLRLLNAPHTLLAAMGLLRRKVTVREAVTDSALRSYLEEAIFQEIVPALDPILGESQRVATETYARQVLERFENPYVEHQLLKICVHCTTKTGVRLFPIMRMYQRVTGQLPRAILRGMAAVITLFRDPSRFPFEDSHRPQMEAHWRGFNGNRTQFALTLLHAHGIWGGNQAEVHAWADVLAEELGRF